MALNFAVRQTRPPKEIVVVDAGENWEATRDLILSTIAAEHPEIRWVYVEAEHRSSTLQRNQGVLLATSDVLFLIDDDSMMYPDCAERIMEVYEADRDHKIMGVQSNFVDQLLPNPDPSKTPARESAYRKPCSGRRAAISSGSIASFSDCLFWTRRSTSYPTRDISGTTLSPKRLRNSALPRSASLTDSG